MEGVPRWTTQSKLKDAALAIIWAFVRAITPFVVSVAIQTFGQLHAGMAAQQAYMNSSYSTSYSGRELYLK